jgi:hypothetical protein
MDVPGSKQQPEKPTILTYQWIESGSSLRWELTTPSPLWRVSVNGATQTVQGFKTSVQKDGKRTTIVATRENGKTMIRQTIISPSSSAMDGDLWSAAGFLLMENPRTSLLDVLNHPDETEHCSEPPTTLVAAAQRISSE